MIFRCDAPPDSVEFPRDPLSDPGPDENMPQGGFQRLMASTTFESPFAKKKLGLNPLGLDEVGFDKRYKQPVWCTHMAATTTCVELLDAVGAGRGFRGHVCENIAGSGSNMVEAL